MTGGSAKSIVVFGEIFSENLGDGVIFDCLAYSLRERSACSVVAADLCLRGASSLTGSPAPLRQPVLLPQFVRQLLRSSHRLRCMVNAGRWVVKERRRHARAWWPVVVESSAVVFGGGQLLDGFDFGFPPKLDLVFDLAGRAARPTAIVGCGVGRTWDPVSRWIVGRAFSESVYISLRDAESRLRAGSLGGPSTAATWHPDFGFLAGRAYGVSRDRNSRLIGLGVQSVSHMGRFVPGLARLGPHAISEFWLDLAARFLADGFDVEFFSNGDSRDHGEAAAIHAFASRTLDEARVFIAPKATRPRALAESIARYRGVVASRLHATILAHSVGIPTVPLSWDRKVTDVWRGIGGGSRTQEWTRLDAATAHRGLMALMRCSDAVVPAELLGEQILGSVDELLASLSIA